MDKAALKALFVRTISGAALFVIVVGAILLSRYSFAALLVAICIGSLYEFYRLADAGGAHPQKIYGIISAAMTVVMSFMTASGIICISPASIFLLFLLFVFITFAYELYRDKPAPLVNIAVTVTGMIYTAVPVSLLCFIAMPGLLVPGADISFPADYFPWRVLCYIFIIWANDVGAYLIGVALGRHRLFERISPKKSWEGFFGGLLFAMGTGLLCGYLLWEGDGISVSQNMMFWGGLALIAALSGVLGDLVESLFKRGAGVKDSGSIMPGHGGFLDRFDALLFSAPFVFAYFIIFTPC